MSLQRAVGVGEGGRWQTDYRLDTTWTCESTAGSGSGIEKEMADGLQTAGHYMDV